MVISPTMERMVPIDEFLARGQYHVMSGQSAMGGFPSQSSAPKYVPKFELTRVQYLKDDGNWEDIKGAGLAAIREVYSENDGRGSHKISWRDENGGGWAFTYDFDRKTQTGDGNNTRPIILTNWYG